MRCRSSPGDPARADAEPRRRDRRALGLGDSYEAFVGRWSRPVARDFLAWLDLPAGPRLQLDVGCGTGALTGSVLDLGGPGSIIGVDPSSGYVDYARRAIPDPRARFMTGDAQRLPLDDASVDAAVSGLVLNFVPDPGRAARRCGASPAPVGPWQPMSGTSAARCSSSADSGMRRSARTPPQPTSMRLVVSRRGSVATGGSVPRQRSRIGPVAGSRRSDLLSRLRRRLDAVPRRTRSGAELRGVARRRGAGSTSRAAARFVVERGRWVDPLDRPRMGRPRAARVGRRPGSRVSA